MAKVIICIVVAVVVIVGGAMLLKSTNVLQDGNITDVTNTYSYTIEGEVSKVGTYVLEEGITMGDLIEAAGGLTYNSDELSFFYDVVLESGNSYYIAGKFDVNDLCNNTEIEKVNINKDPAEELMKINGITSSVATSIVSYRNENNMFKTIEELLDVYGIGNATYRKIRNYVTLHE